MGQIEPTARLRSLSDLWSLEDPNAVLELRFALDITMQDLPNLRIIIIGEARFWIERYAEDNSLFWLWHWQEAMSDLHQHERILEYMDSKD